jgi:hypothetical protein
MKLSAPKKNTWWVALILGIIGIVGHFVVIPIVTPWAWLIVVVAFVLLVLATSVKNM